MNVDVQLHIPADTGSGALDMGCKGTRSTCDFTDHVGLSSFFCRLALMMPRPFPVSKVARAAAGVGPSEQHRPTPSTIYFGGGAWRIGSLARGSLFSLIPLTSRETEPHVQRGATSTVLSVFVYSAFFCLQMVQIAS